MKKLIFYDGKSLDITDEQAEIFTKESCGKNPGMKINGFYVAFKGVSRIENVPENPYKQLPEPEKITYSKQRYLRALTSIRRGFLGHFAGRELPKQSQSILDKINAKLEKINALPDNAKINSDNILQNLI